LEEKIFNFVYSDAEKKRLDKFLVVKIPEHSRAFLQGLIVDGFVKVDDKTITKSSLLLEQDQKILIRIPPPQPTDLIPEDIPLDIIFENDDLMVINKPAGMVVHPAVGHSTGTLVHAALSHAPEMDGISREQRPGIVHRLDKDTSGLIVVAKNDLTHHWLQDQFRLRKVHKTYFALVDGAPPTPKGRVEAPIGRDPSHRKQMAIVSLGKGREAVTEYQVKERFPKHCLVEVYPLTGRTHQIRLHLKFLGCPIVGDQIYGHKHLSVEISRQFLHAGRLNITLPGESQPREFIAPLPPELEEVIDKLRSQK
jgi:23S rRNA pseudouridine1911/1915/1917 synthase